MKLKKVFGSFIIISILSGCQTISTKEPIHTPIEVEDGYLTEDNNLFIKYNGDNIEVVEGTVYTKYSIDNAPLQLIPITETEFINNKYNFGNLKVDLENNIIQCFVKDKVTEHHLSRVETVLVPGLISYWDKLPSYKNNYPGYIFFPNVEGQILAYNQELSQLAIPKGEELILIEVEESFEPISYIDNASQASQLKIKANRYMRENGIYNSQAIFGTASSQIGIVYDDKLIFFMGG